MPSIEWSTLGLGVVASIISAAAIGLSETILSAGAWVSSALLSIGTYIEELGESAGSIITEPMSVAVESWESFVGVFGPAAFPVSVAVGIGMIVVVFWVVYR